MDSRFIMSERIKWCEIPATDRRNNGGGEEGCLMMDVGREHVSVDDLRSSSKERDDEKIPPYPPLSKWGVRNGHEGKD
jgi:hypothetical protein